VGLSLLGERDFSPIFGAPNRVRVVCWVHPVVVELYDSSLCFGEFFSLVFYSIEFVDHVGDG